MEIQFFHISFLFVDKNVILYFIGFFLNGEVEVSFTSLVIKIQVLDVVIFGNWLSKLIELIFIERLLRF